MEQRLDKLIEEIKYELFHYPKTTKKQDLKYVIKRLLRPGNTPKRDHFFWTHALLAQALECAGEVEILKQYYDLWIEKGIPISNVDNIMNGYSLLYVYEKTGEDKYKQAANHLYYWVCNYAKEAGNPLPYRKNHPTHIYVDGLGMLVPFLCRYGAFFQIEEATRLGIKQVREFLKYGMDESTGLPYHGYDVKTKVKQGIIGWGRAVGWLMLSMADSMEYLPEGNEKEELKDAFAKLTEAVLNYLREDGYFSWQLSALEGPKDTSATAMIGYAVKKVYFVCHQESEEKTENLREYAAAFTGEETGTMKHNLKEIMKQLQKAMMNSYKNGNIYDCSGECEGFSQHPQVYGAYPWSLGPGTSFLTI